MISSILIGVDDSEGAAVALRWAVGLLEAEAARGNQPDVVAVAAWTSPPLDLVGMVDGRLLEQASVDVLDRILAGVPGAERFERVVLPGPPAEVVIDEADRRDVDLIVLGSRGRGALAQLLLGSVSRAVASRADRPVAIVPPSASWSGGPTVVGYDGSPGAVAALEWAVAATDGPIVVVSAWHLPTDAIYDPGSIDVGAFESQVRDRLDRAVAAVDARFSDDDVASRVEAVVQRDDPRLALVEQAKVGSQTVLGARAHRGLRGLLLGSTVDYVASHADQAVVIVPPPHETPEGAGDG
jgi:nucleotide-binding universal stress UspA family protein